MNARRVSKINENSHSSEVAAGNYFAWRCLCDVSGGHNVLGSGGGGEHNGIFRLQAAVMDASLSPHRSETQHKI